MTTVCQHIIALRSEAPAGTYMLVADRTVTYRWEEDDVRRATEGGIPQALLEALVAQHTSTPMHVSDPRFPTITLRTIKRLFRDGPVWNGFYQEYPNSRGFVEISGPVFNAQRSEALLYVDYNCGGLCGWGSFYHLRRDTVGWRIAHEYMVFISGASGNRVD